jgi:tight adherence protein C
MPAQLLVIGFIGLLGCAVAILGVTLQRKSVINIDERLNTFGERPLSFAEQEMARPFRERVILPIIHRLSNALGSRSSSKSVDKMRAKLAAAGNPSGFGPGEFVGLRLLLALGISIGLFFLMTIMGTKVNSAMMFALVGGAFGFMFPGIWLDRKIKSRKKEIGRSLPDAIDLLTISVESGLGFDPALMRVSEKWDNALTREFARVLSELRIGKSKREALREMATRCDDDGLSTFVSSVVQADTLGVAISQVLRIQSEAMRMKRRQRAEEQAQKAPLKMLFPMIFLIFPALYVVILGPAIPRIVETFSK